MTTNAPERTDGHPAARVSRALGWSFTNTAVGRLGTIAIGVVLARLLGPEAFGRYAIAYVALVAVLSFNELGVSLAIVRWPGSPRAIAPTVTTISVVVSAVVAGVVYVAAPAFATAMGDPGATSLVRLLGVCVVINGVVATPAALLQREFRQDRRMAVDQVNVWVGALVSVGLALAGFGALGLVVGRVAGALVSAVLFVWWSPEPFRFGLDRNQLRPLLAFGLPLAGASIVVFAAGYIDQIVVGRVLGAVALGYYVLAFNLSSWPVTLFSQPLRSVAPAVFARLQGQPEQMRGTFARVLRPLGAMALPVCLAVAAAAPQLVGFVYGDRWLPAADALRWLALLAFVRILVELAYDYLVVLGRSRSLLAVQAGWFVAIGIAVLVGAQRAGIAGAAGAQALVGVLLVVPTYLWLLSREGLRAQAVLRQLIVPMVGATALAAAVVMLGRMQQTEMEFLGVVLVLGVLTVVGLLILSRGDLHALRAAARLVEG
jgi:O-antigen/teichoic acid export membrane protein